MKTNNDYIDTKEINPLKALLLIFTLVGVLMLMGFAWPSNTNTYNISAQYAQVVD